MLDLRSINDNIDIKRDELFDEYYTNKYLKKDFLLKSLDDMDVTAHPFCHPKGTAFSHADTDSVKAQASCFVKIDHILCQGNECFRENKSDKPKKDGICPTV